VQLLETMVYDEEEVLARSGYGLTVRSGEFFFFVVHHRFQKLDHGGELAGAQLVDQRVRLLLVGHEILTLLFAARETVDAQTERFRKFPAPLFHGFMMPGFARVGGSGTVMWVCCDIKVAELP